MAPEPLTSGGNLPERWKRYVRTFEQFLVATGRADKPDPVKIALLLRTIGQRGNDMFDAFTWDADADRQVYQTVVDKFNSFCAPRVNVVAMTHKLLTKKQGQLTIDEYVTELHNVARDCNLGGREQYERMMIQALLLGIENDRVRRRLFERQDFTLDEAIATCRAMESAREDLRTVQTPAETVHAIKPATRKYAKQKKQEHEHCRKCGDNHPPRKCKAYGKECFKCRKMNHFSKCCTSKTVKANLVQSTKPQWNYSSDESTNSIHLSKQDRKMMATVHVVNGTVQGKVKFQLDTAATCNMLTRRDYTKMGKPKLTDTKTPVTLYDDSTVMPDGWCTMTVKDNANNTHHLNFLVMNTGQHSLLSLNTCLDLSLIQMNESVHLVSDEPIENILMQYENVFHGIGCLPGEYDIEIDPSVTPVQVRPRKIALSMKEDVKAKLDVLETQGVIEKVDIPTPWISHLQPVRKSNGTVRLCLDPQNLNQALRRNHFQMPDIDDVLPQLAEAKVFSLCDAKDGFLQVKLSEKSSHLTTFWTPYGRYKWKRMPFGISIAPEEFQRRLSTALEGLEGVSVVADDILIYGKDRAQHDENLRKFLKRASKCELKLNKKKCRFHMTELPYIGHVLTSEGVKPDPKKVSAIKDTEAPRNSEDVRRFLGHVNYMAKCLPNLSAESEPLRRLLNLPDDEFCWGVDQRNAYETLKQMLTSEKLLQYYDSRKPIVIQTDASTAGLGVVLMQEDKPVAYASRSLTKGKPTLRRSSWNV